MAAGASSPKLRVAWFSVLNTQQHPGPSVSAYVSDTLLPLLRSRLDIELFHNEFGQYKDYPTHHYLSAFQRDASVPYDYMFYQLDDTRASNFLRVHLGLMPGLVWFHDFVFTTFGPEPILNSPWKLVVEKFQHAGVAWPDRDAKMEQHGPLGFREAAWAAQALFSNPVAHSEYRRSIHRKLSMPGTHAPSLCLPMPVSAKLQREAAEFRGRICFCGSPQIEHRAHKLLEALRNIDAPYSLHWLLADAEIPAAEELVREFGVSRVELIGGRSPEMWAKLAATCDVATHLLFSVYGQPDPYLAMSLVLGLPTITTRFGATDYIPDALSFKVQPGDTEATELAGVLQAILGGRVDYSCEHIRAFGLERHSAQFIAGELAGVFENCRQFHRQFRQRWQAFERSARKDILAETINLLPGANNEQKALDWQRLCEPVFRDFGWTE